MKRTHSATGKELYFWTLIVALLVFVLGGGVSVAEGVSHISNRRPIVSTSWNYAILALSVLCEGSALFVSLREFRQVQGRLSLWKAIQQSKDPSTFTVISEDTAALVGLMAASIGIFLAQALNMPQLDGAASIAIGLVLIAVALLLVIKSKALLVGEGADKRVLRSLRDLALVDEAVERVGYPLTMYFGPHNVLLTMNVQFRKDLSGVLIEKAVDRIEVAIRNNHPDIRHIYLEADTVRTISLVGAPAFPEAQEFHPGSS